MLSLSGSPIPADERNLLNILEDNSSMLELGNKKNKRGIYKKFFKKKGINHISIDWNARDGAIEMDLRIKHAIFYGHGRWNQYFDIITNFGTTEHIIPQAYVWSNILNALKVDGILSSITPLPGDWTWHHPLGQYPTMAFYIDLAENNGLEILKLYHDGNHPKRKIFAQFMKKEHLEDIKINEELIYINKRNYENNMRSKVRRMLRP